MKISKKHILILTLSIAIIYIVITLTELSTYSLFCKTRIKNEDKYYFSIVTPTVKREGGEYIHVLAANIWTTIPPSRRKLNVNKWTIINGNEEIYKFSALDCVRNTYSKLLGDWWEIKNSKNQTTLIDEAMQRILEHPDDDSRKRWRIKEALDYIQSLECALESSSTHIVILQDDILLTYDWLGTSIQYFNENPIDALYLMRIGTYYVPFTVAAIYTRPVAELLVYHLKKDYWSAPIDGRISTLLRKLKLNYDVAAPSLAQHVGISSSLVGKLQILTTGNYGWGVVGHGITSPASFPFPPPVNDTEL